MNPLLDDLAGFRRRVKALMVWQGLGVGLAIGAVSAVLWAALDYFGVWFTDWTRLGLVVLAGGLIGGTFGAMRKVRPEHLADSIDRRAGLKNRLRTALGATGEWADAVQTDAEESVGKVSPKQVFPIRLGRGHKSAGAFGAVAAAVFLLGNSPLLLNDRQKLERKEMQDAATAVERVAKPVLDEPTDLQTKRIAEDLRRFAEELERGRLEKPEALQDADELARKAEELAKKRFAESERLLDEAQTAHDRAMQSGEQSNTAQAQKLESKLADLKAKLGEASTQAEKDAIQSEIAQVEQALQELKLSEEARKTFEKLMSMPEYRELMEMARKLRKEAQAGQQGKQKLTEEQIEEMQRKLEELAKQLKDEEAMREYIEKLREAMKKAEGG